MFVQSIAILGALIALGSLWLLATIGEMELSSFALSKLSLVAIPISGMPSDVRDITFWRSLYKYYNNVNNLLHTTSSTEKMILDMVNNSNETVNFVPKLKLYRPKTLFASKELVQRDVLVWFHAGGFILGDFEQDDFVCSAFSQLSDAIVVSVSYCLSPECSFPAAIAQAFQALQWVHRNIASYGGNPTKVVLSGEGAGGNLAAALTSMNFDELHVSRQDRISIIGLLLIYPPLEFGVRRGSNSQFEFTNGLLTSAQLDKHRDMYTGDYTHYDGRQSNNDKEKALFKFFFNYTFSPMKTPHRILKQYPPTVIILAKYDVLTDDGLDFGKLLRLHGVSVESKIYDSTIHGFFGKFWSRKGVSALLFSCEKVRAFYQKYDSCLSLNHHTPPL
jgi:acetyl esterase/lipase